MTAERRARRGRITRDSVLFSAGLAGVFYETVFDRADRPTLLLLFGAMMGLPAFLRTDEQVRSKKDAAAPQVTVSGPVAPTPTASSSLGGEMQQIAQMEMQTAIQQEVIRSMNPPPPPPPPAPAPDPDPS